jgi:hypothetical protein
LTPKPAGEPFRKSRNDFDWLGEGVYFWEYGHDRALQFADEQRKRGKVAITSSSTSSAMARSSRTTTATTSRRARARSRRWRRCGPS